MPKLSDLGAEIDRGASIINQQDSVKNDDIEAAMHSYKGDPLNDPFDLDSLSEEFYKQQSESNSEPESLENSDRTLRPR